MLYLIDKYMVCFLLLIYRAQSYKTLNFYTSIFYFFSLIIAWREQSLNWRDPLLQAFVLFPPHAHRDLTL